MVRSCGNPELRGEGRDNRFFFSFLRMERWKLSVLNANKNWLVCFISVLVQRYKERGNFFTRIQEGEEMARAGAHGHQLRLHLVHFVKLENSSSSVCLYASVWWRIRSRRPLPLTFSTAGFTSGPVCAKRWG